MSAEPSRPWWATPDDDRDHLDDRDPVDAHRAGRRGEGEAGPRDASRPGGESAGHDPDVCGVCPWCAGMRLLAASHPEAVTHLSEAARHLSQAVRSLVAEVQRADGAAKRDDGADHGHAPFEHIDLD